MSADSAKVSVFVAVPIAEAFEIFTKEIDRWWRQGPKYRLGGTRRGTLFMEEGVGGRLFETFEVASGGTRTFEVGKITVWEPPRELQLEWRIANFKAGEKTFVEVLFETTAGSESEGTLVTVRHYGWSAIPDDHPARHGQVGAAFLRAIGMWWASLLTSLREHTLE